MFKNYRIPMPTSARMDTYLQNNTFCIPIYQRPFSWGAQQADDLFQDNLRVVNQLEDNHYFGDIELMPVSYTKMAEINGQQRTTTSMVYLAMMRNRANELMNKASKKKNMTGTVSDLNNMISRDNGLLFNSGIVDKEHLTLQLGNKSDTPDEIQYVQCFNGMILNDRAHSFTQYANSDYAPIQLLIRVRRTLRDDIRKYLNNDKYNTLKKKAQALINLFDTFTHQFYIIAVQVHNPLEAVTMYLTLNARGKGLSLSNIIKDSLVEVVHKGKGNTIATMKKWNEMVDFLGNDNEKTSKFISIVWSTAHGSVSKTHLVHDIITNVNSLNKAKSFLKTLARLAPVYKCLLKPTSKNNVFTSPRITHDIVKLNSMKLSQYYPVTLALYYRHYNDDEDKFADVMDMVVNAVMRGIERTDISNKYGAMKNLFDGAARAIWTNKDDLSLTDIRSLLEQKDDSDNLIAENTKRLEHHPAKSGKSNTIFMYQLAGIYYESNNEFNTRDNLYNNIFANQNFTLIQLTHDNQNYVDNAGNWTLIENKLAKKLQGKQNQNIENVIDVLNQSKLLTNRKLANELSKSDSSVHFIDARQDKISKIYPKAWIR